MLYCRLLSILIISYNCIGDESQSRASSNLQDIQEITFLTDDQFIYQTIESSSQLDYIGKVCQQFNKKYTFIRNQFYGFNDTITIYNKSKDTVTIYSTIDKKIILKLNLYSDKIGLLNDTIRIGMDKNYFLRKYPSIKKFKVIKISNSEGLACFQFTFTNDILSNIKYLCNYLD
jgi:hypothetical protein